MRDILTSPRVIEINRRKRNKKIRLFVLLSILLVSIISSLAYFSADRHVTINKIIVSGNRIIDREEIEFIANKDMMGRYFYLFYKANSLIYPRSKIYDDLIKAFPRIQSLSISRDNLNTLHINIEERSGTFLYCGSKPPEVKSDVGENCYFINNDGYIFDKAPYFSLDVYFKYYVSLDGKKNLSNSPLGEQMLEVNYFHSIVRFIDSLNYLGFRSTQLVASDGGVELFLSNDGFPTIPKIIFKSDNDLDIIFNNLSLSMKKPEFANQIKDKYTTLQYIDLRFKNKVLYKFN